MKKTLILIAFLMATGGLFYFYYSQTTAPNGNTGNDNSTQPTDSQKQLETLAGTNEAFRWSLEIENKYGSGRLYVVNGDRDFRTRFANDKANQSHQQWSGGQDRQWEYKQWVEGFYSGRGIVGNGWTVSARDLVEKNNDPQTVRYVNILGRIIAAEWSKSSEIRRIDNGNLISWQSLTTAERLPELAQAIHDQLNQK